MTKPSPDDVTVLLEELAKGDQGAASKLVPLVYDELLRLARIYLRRERPDPPLEATDLVHKTYLTLVQKPNVKWSGRAEFFSVAAQVMRQILVNHARARVRGTSSKTLKLDLSIAEAQLRLEQDTRDVSSPAEDFAITFDPGVTREAITHTLSALGDYYRACGGVGLRIGDGDLLKARPLRRVQHQGRRHGEIST